MDKRSDIWAFGCVLFAMLTGRTPFDGDTQRLTDLVGVNESPALSPDGRMVAFVAPVDGRRQIWIRMLSGGAPLRVTHDDGDHEYPRWTVDGTAIIYYARPEMPGESGMLYEVSALGGPPRPLVTSSGGADCSHDGRRLVLFRPDDGRAELVAMWRDDARTSRIAYGPLGCTCESVRRSPDDRWIVFHTRGIGRFTEHLHIVPADGSHEPMLIARASALRGVSWLSDSSGVVYSSAAGSTVPYPSDPPRSRSTR